MPSVEIAALIVDALVQAKIVEQRDVERAIKIATEELDARRRSGTTEAPLCHPARVVGGLVGLALYALMLLVVYRYSGLSRAQLDEWGTVIAIAPFAAAAVVVVYLQRRRAG